MDIVADVLGRLAFDDARRMMMFWIKFDERIGDVVEFVVIHE